MKALITGASSGLGRDMAYYLSDMGYELILVARRKERMEEIKQKVKTNVKIIEADLANEKEVFLVYDKTKNDNIDLLINGAGFGLFGTFDKTNLEKELEMINVNIKAVHILTKLFLKDMIKKDSGYILNVSSVAGFTAGPELSTYYSTKNYVLKETMAISAELKKKKSHVKVCSLCPGPFNTEFNKVAGVSFSAKGDSSDKIAKYGIDKCLKGKNIIIPGVKWKLLIFFTRFVPYSLITKFIGNFQHKKINGKK